MLVALVTLVALYYPGPLLSQPGNPTNCPSTEEAEVTQCSVHGWLDEVVR